jgi:uncharacterized alpha/beta hydrolase family protein
MEVGCEASRIEASENTYFLQEYAMDKIPILFVHGSGGNPTDFRVLIEGLDRSRYYPWF